LGVWAAQLQQYDPFECLHIGVSDHRSNYLAYK
jgi:hypothetical protein